VFDKTHMTMTIGANNIIYIIQELKLSFSYLYLCVGIPRKTHCVGIVYIQVVDWAIIVI